MKKLEQLIFSDDFQLLGESYFSYVDPSAVPDPYLISANADVAGLLGLDESEAERSLFTELFSGNRPLPGCKSLAMLYAGHQFGHFVPQLGDGRAIMLGQLQTDQGDLWDLHLKGGGPTPYSRNADGRAVLRSSIREYLCGEAMHHLGIPSSRALCLIGSDMEVYREQIESAAMIVRVAPSHIRFGSFEVFYYRNQMERLKPLADYVIKQHFPHLLDTSNPYLAWLAEVSDATAKLMAHWQAVGFAHGVMNTDNMSVLGITLDYGPFGFLDQYDSGFICNHSDHQGRYAFDQQPSIGLWNLTCLAQAILPLIDDDNPERGAEQAKAVLSNYQATYQQYYMTMMRAKLGLQEQHEDDELLLNQLLEIMQRNHTDYTILWRSLSSFDTRIAVEENSSRDHVTERSEFDRWAEKYRVRLLQESSDDKLRQAAMNQVNPKYILRNYLAQVAIDKAEKKDFSEVNNLLELLRNPFDEQPDMEAYAAYPPDWAQKIEVSCSS